MGFKFELSQRVAVGNTTGTVEGRAEYTSTPINQYSVRVLNLQTGLPEDRWFEEGQLTDPDALY